MNRDQKRSLEVIVWIVVPAGKETNEDSLSSWLSERVGDWLNAVKGGAHPRANVRIVALPPENVSFSEAARRRIAQTIATVLNVQDIEFAPPECLRNCDLAVNACVYKMRQSKGCAEEPHRLLLIDSDGMGFPCYGYWKAFKEGVDGFIRLDRDTLMGAYARGAFHSLCAECATVSYAHFPCSYSGAQVKSTFWGEGGTYPHIQFGEDSRVDSVGTENSHKGKRCEHHAPVFEMSLERSRRRLEDILFRGEFWKQALLDNNKQLEHYWPGDAGSAIPIYGSYPISDDCPAWLDIFPPSNAFAQEFDELREDDGAYAQVQRAFLPICFLPHLRVLFDLVKPASLLSIVLADRHRDSEFRYRSLYRNGAAELGCFDDDTTWKRLWRLPYEWDVWRENVLNLSSAVRAATLAADQEIPPRVDYLALLSPVQYPEHGVNTAVLDLSGVCTEFRRQLEERAYAMRQIVKEMPYRNGDDSTSALLPVFFTPEKPEDNEAGIEAWRQLLSALRGQNTHTDSGRRSGCDLYVNGIQRHPMRWSEMPEGDRSVSGCRLLNYILWLKSVFQEDVQAIETYNSIQVSTKQPSQFVLFARQPLTLQDHARFKLTLTALLQPVESAYAIGTEIDQHQLQLASTVYAAGHSQKHIFGYMTAPLETLEGNPAIHDTPNLKSMVDELRALTNWAENSSKNMDLFTSLWLHRGKVEALDAGFFAPERSVYCIGERVRCFLARLTSAGYRIDVSSEGLKELDRAELVERIPTKSGFRRLADSFYDELFQEILFNARRWSAGESTVCLRSIADILPLIEDSSCLSASTRDTDTVLIFSNPPTASALRGWGLSSKYVSWLAHAQKGGLCYAAMRLEATRQGHLLVRREEKDGHSYFNLAVIIHDCRRTSDGAKPATL